MRFVGTRWAASEVDPTGVEHLAGIRVVRRYAIDGDVHPRNQAIVIACPVAGVRRVEVVVAGVSRLGEDQMAIGREGVRAPKVRVEGSDVTRDVADSDRTAGRVVDPDGAGIPDSTNRVTHKIRISRTLPWIGKEGRRPKVVRIPHVHVDRRKGRRGGGWGGSKSPRRDGHQAEQQERTDTHRNDSPKPLITPPPLPTLTTPTPDPAPPNL